MERDPVGEQARHKEMVRDPVGVQARHTEIVRDPVGEQAHHKELYVTLLVCRHVAWSSCVTLPVSRHARVRASGCAGPWL